MTSSGSSSSAPDTNLVVGGGGPGSRASGCQPEARLGAVPTRRREAAGEGGAEARRTRKRAHATRRHTPRRGRLQSGRRPHRRPQAASGGVCWCWCWCWCCCAGWSLFRTTEDRRACMARLCRAAAVLRRCTWACALARLCPRRSARPGRVGVDVRVRNSWRRERASPRLGGGAAALRAAGAALDVAATADSAVLAGADGAAVAGGAEMAARPARSAAATAAWEATAARSAMRAAEDRALPRLA